MNNQSKLRPAMTAALVLISLCFTGCARLCGPRCGGAVCGDGVCAPSHAFERWQGCGPCEGPKLCPCTGPACGSCDSCGPSCACEPGCACEPDSVCEADCACEPGCDCEPECACEPGCECEEPCGCGSSCGPGKSCNLCYTLKYTAKRIVGGLFKPLRGCSGCDGELYWSEWHNDPPRCCDPCDRCGNWIGPAGGYRAPYDHEYSPVVGSPVIEEPAAGGSGSR